jgi:hypothetical protein
VAEFCKEGYGAKGAVLLLLLLLMMMNKPSMKPA